MLQKICSRSSFLCSVVSAVILASGTSAPGISAANTSAPVYSGSSAAPQFCPILVYLMVRRRLVGPITTKLISMLCHCEPRHLLKYQTLVDLLVYGLVHYVLCVFLIKSLSI